MILTVLADVSAKSYLTGLGLTLDVETNTDLPGRVS